MNLIIKEIVELKRRLKKNNIRGLALDVDDTLSSTIGYMLEKLMEGLGNPKNLTIEEILKKYKNTDEIPFWQGEKAEEILENIRNSNKVQRELILIKNANITVNKINKIIPISAYITVRSKVIYKGTKFWLQKNNFPVATIITRPSEVLRKDGSRWKAEVLEYLYPEILGIVDDNPDLVKYLCKSYKGIIFLYNNSDFLNKDIRVIKCKNWKVVLSNIKKYQLQYINGGND